LKEKQNRQIPNTKAIEELFSDPEEILLVETPYPSGSQEDSKDVDHPDHYTMGIEVTDFIASWEMDWFRGNILKYIVRCPFKGNTLKDLKKAKWYMDDLIKRYEDGKYIL